MLVDMADHLFQNSMTVFDTFDKPFDTFDKSFDAFNKPFDTFDKLFDAFVDSINHLIHSINHLIRSINYLMHSINHLMHSINHLIRSINYLMHSINHLMRSINYLMQLFDAGFKLQGKVALRHNVYCACAMPPSALRGHVDGQEDCSWKELFLRLFLNNKVRLCITASTCSVL